MKGEPIRGTLDGEVFMVQRSSRTDLSPAERNQELEREVAERGFKPLTADELARRALGTPEEGEDLLEVSAEVRRQARGRHRS